MKNFQLYGFKYNQPVLITNTEVQSSPASSFEEKLTKKENKRYSFSFSMYKNIVTTEGVIINPFLSLLQPSAKLRLIINNEITDFVITEISYTITSKNVKYTCKAEDYASQMLSKIGTNMTVDKTGTISELADEIILQSNSNGLWTKLVTGTFKSSINEDQDRKATLVLTSTNFYNAFIELALLFNAEIDFQYDTKQVILKDKDKRPFKGFRLRPEVNISSFGISDNVSNFTTAMRIIGGTDVNGLIINPIPRIPYEVKLFYADCVTNNFSGDTWFNDFTRTKYISFYDRIVNTYTTDKSAENLSKIKEYLQTCDLLPHLENTLYDIYYFRLNGRISQYKYDQFYYKLNNIIRKINMYLMIRTEEYYSLLSEYSISANEIDNVISFLVNEEIYYSTIDGAAADTLKTKSEATQAEYKKKLEGLVTDSGYINTVLNLWGKTSSYNPFRDKLRVEAVSEKTKLTEEYNLNTSKITTITSQLESLSDTSAKYIILSTEKAGLEKRQKFLEARIGKTGVTSGFYGWLITYIDLSTTTVTNNSSLYGKTYTSLYDHVIDETKPINLRRQKKEQFKLLYQTYENFIVESIYENTNELDSYALLEQAYLNFYGGTIPKAQTDIDAFYKRQLGNNTPNRSYNLSFIDLSFLENYRYLNIEIGNMIELYEPQLGIDGERMAVTQIDYDLRNANNTKLGVKLYTEDIELLQKLLLNL